MHSTALSSSELVKSRRVPSAKLPLEKIYRQGACSEILRHLSPSTSKKPEEGFFCPAGPSIVETPPQENMKPLKS